MGVVKFEKRVWPPVPSTETEKPMVPVKPTVKPPPTSKPPPPREPSYKPPPKPLASAKPQVCNIYAAPSSVTARNSTTSTSSSSRLNISTPPVAKPKPPPAAASASETLSERNGEGTKEAAAKASKELEGSLAKLGNNISKADAMAIAEQADGLAAACDLHVDSAPPTGRFHFRSLLTKLDSQTKELRSLNVSRAAEASKLVKELQSTVKELGTAIQR